MALRSLHAQRHVDVQPLGLHHEGSHFRYSKSRTPRLNASSERIGWTHRLLSVFWVERADSLKIRGAVVGVGTGGEPTDEITDSVYHISIEHNGMAWQR